MNQKELYTLGNRHRFYDRKIAILDEKMKLYFLIMRDISLISRKHFPIC